MCDQLYHHPTCNCHLYGIHNAVSGYAFVEGTGIPEGKTSSSGDRRNPDPCECSPNPCHCRPTFDRRVSDLINSPPHYTKGGIDTFDFIKAKGLSYEEGNVIKYITRSRHKGKRLDDLRKAEWYLKQLIAEAEKQ